MKSETGGNANYKADQIEYQTYRPDGLEAATNEIFVSLGYRPINNSQVEAVSDGKFNVSQFESEFASNENISNETLSNAFAAISNIIPLLVVARLDVGVPIIKGGNENPLVVVDVKAQVYQFDGLFYETVASYGPAQVKKSGITSTAAENNAILEASRKAASQLGAQLLQNKIY
jgi:hypothetical protein